MCQWLMTASTEWLTEVEFTLNCTESKWVAFSATPRAKWHWTFTVTSWFPGNFGGQNVTRKRSWPLLSQSIRHREFRLLVRVCSHTCLHISVFVFHWGLFLRVKFRAKFEPASLTHSVLVFCFCKTKFCCKMHMQKFCTEVTVLPS